MNKKVKKRVPRRKIERDLLKIIVFFALLILLFFVVSGIFKNINEFEYEGLRFTKEKFGELPVFHYYYYFNSQSGKLFKYNLYIRNDPRSNDIPVEGGRIKFLKRGTVYITMDATDLGECKNSLLAIGTLSGFLTDNQLKVKSGTTDIVEAATYGDNGIEDYITCENKPSNAVISFSRGDETKIVLDGHCHEIIVGPKCDVLEAVEKYEIRSILDTKED